MKAPLSQWILVGVACFIVASCVRSEPVADRPPGVDEADWIPISTSAGIVLTSVFRMPVSGTLRFRGDGAVQETPLQLRVLQQGTGTGILMVKLGDAWMRIDMELPNARVHPLL